MKTPPKFAAATFAASLLAASASAQVTSFGNDCAGGSGIPPVLSSQTFPVSGQLFTLDLSGPPLSAGSIIVGGSNTLWSGVPLPLDLTLFGVLGCDLNVSFDLTIPIALNGLGQLSLSTTGSSPGSSVFLQLMLIDPGPQGVVSFSKGMGVTYLGPTGMSGGEVIITEIMKDPDLVGDEIGEWFEVYNTTAADIDIEYWSVEDLGGEFARLDNGGAGIVVPAGDFITLGNNDDPLLNGFLTHAGTFDPLFAITNGSDEIILKDYTGLEVDRVVYDNGVTWPDPKGASMSLAPAALDGVSNDLGANWTSGTCPIGGSPYNDDKGTPGYDNGQCNSGPPPTPSGELIFSEIMANPTAVGDDTGEWLEIYNTLPFDVDLQGYLIVWGGAEFVNQSVIVPANGYALLAKNANLFQNGGLPTPDYVWGPALFLGNGSETIQLLNPAMSLVARVHYDNGVTFPDPSGATMQLDPAHLNSVDSQDGSFWCVGAVPYGAGDLGTPQSANSVCP